MGDDWQVYLLHNREDLLQETAELINQEWPRSTTARLASISGGKDDFPCSLVLTDRGGRVVCHARIMTVVGNPQAALIETVIVSPSLRGQGLGRRVMEEAELHAARVGCKTVHLSTHDKVGFYSHLGYTAGPLVSPLRKCVAKYGQGLEIEPCVVEDSEAKDEVTMTTNNVEQSLAPPPPAPPPPKVKEVACTETIHWMMKSLV